MAGGPGRAGKAVCRAGQGTERRHETGDILWSGAGGCGGGLNVILCLTENGKKDRINTV